MGILHGDIPKNLDDSVGKIYSGLPFECPKCEKGLLNPQKPEKVVCDNPECKEELDFVWAHSRAQNYAKPPDILITNPDTLIWRLMLEPEHHSIFGREVLACQDCGMTYAVTGRKNSCNARGGCNGKNIKKILPTPPSFLVFDEIHLFKGSFGINTSYLLTRIESVIKHYAKVFHSEDNHKITRIGSTATISNSIEFVKKFFNVNENKYWIIPEDQDKLEDYYEIEESDDSFSRHHVYLMPYAYTSDSTVGMTIQYIEALAKNGKPPTRLAEKLAGQDRYLQILTFVNSIKASNSLISQTRRMISTELPDMQVDGHTTDFDKSQRSDVEKKFNRQELHVVFATSTLEVGVDFRNVHCVLINGFPYSFNDYLQRIGRGGRRGDSLVVTVCQNWKPVDHYYYSHGRSALRDQHKNIEPIPITRNNGEAIRRHVYGACLDYIVMNKDTKYDTTNITSLENISKDREEINASVLSSCKVPTNLENDALLVLDEFVYYIETLVQTTKMERKPKAFYSRFLDDINPRYNLTSLRSTDPDVPIEVFLEPMMEGTTTRSLGIVLRTLYPGAFASHQGVTFRVVSPGSEIISGVSPDNGKTEKIDDELWEHPNLAKKVYKIIRKQIEQDTGILLPEHERRPIRVMVPGKIDLRIDETLENVYCTNYKCGTLWKLGWLNRNQKSRGLPKCALCGSRVQQAPIFVPVIEDSGIAVGGAGMPLGSTIQNLPYRMLFCHYKTPKHGCRAPTSVDRQCVPREQFRKMLGSLVMRNPQRPIDSLKLCNPDCPKGLQVPDIQITRPQRVGNTWFRTDFPREALNVPLHASAVETFEGEEPDVDEVNEVVSTLLGRFFDKEVVDYQNTKFTSMKILETVYGYRTGSQNTGSTTSYIGIGRKNCAWTNHKH